MTTINSSETRELAMNRVDNIINDNKAVVDNIIKKYFGDKWGVVYFDDRHVNIGFVSGMWDSENPQYTIFDICYGNLCYKSTEFEFTVNVSAMGSFTIDSTCSLEENKNEYRCRMYYSGIGILMNNIEFQKELKTTLQNLHNEVREINYAIFKYDSEQQRIKNEEAMKKAHDELLEYKKTYEEFVKNNPNGYVVVNTAPCYEETFAIYRRKPVVVIGYADNYKDAVRFVDRHSYTHKLVEVKKVKVA